LLKKQNQIVQNSADQMAVRHDELQRKFKSDAGNYFLTSKETVLAK